MTALKPKRPKRITTDKTVAGLKPDEGRYAVPDAEEAGLEIRVHEDGAKVWAFRYRIHGRQRRLTLGSYRADGREGVSLSKARSLARIARGKVEAGIDPRAEQEAAELAAREAIEQAAKAKRDSIEALADAYLVYAKARKRSWRSEDLMLRREILPVWKGRPITSITHWDCIELAGAVSARRSPRSSGYGVYGNRVAGLLSVMFQWAMGDSRFRLPANPAARLPMPGVEVSKRPEGERESKPYTPDEIRLIWERTEALGPAQKALYRVQLLTGTRPSEVSGMAWDEIDGEWWTIPAGRSKNGRAHRVFLVPEARELLNEIPRIVGKPRVFNGCLSTRERCALNGVVFRGIRLRGKPRHALRDTCATGLASLGVRVEDISKVLNHVTSGSRMTAIYNSYSYDAEKRAALLRWASELARIIAGDPRQNVVAFDGRAR